MTSHSSTHAAGDDSHSEPGRVKLFVIIALILGVITALEIAVLFMPIIDPVRIAMLVVFSLVKFALVIFIFMHLKWDRLFCTLLFLMGLSLASGTVTILIHVFKVKDSVPLTSHASITAPAQLDAVSRTA